ncbi:TetR/AcrR family transcriptional regulator [Kribbella qitaiheensis]|uniref:TetR/AcrR family transcriptional regulator n=2 Tax=Kribbella qitaiheensis TaxID=1544730 RepID=A0A7G6X9L0_9ACTN|nr:TetR/AcrR family transcriptional regulator [Kribbella qitaiheensis]
MRADARRNYERLIAVAAEVVAEQGADASMEEIARRAGVGSATLHRHFGSRQALLEEVFLGSVDLVCAEAERLLEHPDRGRALTQWLRGMVGHATTNRGLGAALILSAEAGSKVHLRIRTAGDRLLSRARAQGAVRETVRIDDLLKLVNAISLVSGPEAAEADRLLGLVLTGVLLED